MVEKSITNKWSTVKGLPGMNKLMKDLIMQQFPADFFPHELQRFLTGTGLEHSVSMIQSCSPCLLITYTRIVLTHLSPIYIPSNTQRNKHKMLIASWMFNQLGWWSTALGSQPNPVCDEVIFATVWITSHRRFQKWCSLGQSSYSLFWKVSTSFPNRSDVLIERH